MMNKRKYQIGGYVQPANVYNTFAGKKVLNEDSDGGRSALDQGSRAIASGFNWIMGKVGNAFNTIITAGASTDFGQTSPFAAMDRHAVARGREQARQKAKRTIEKNSIYVSPSSYVAAWTQGSWNPKVGAQFLASDPRLQALGIIGDLATFKYAPKTVKAVPATVDKGLAVTGNKAAKGRVVAREINKGIDENTRNGRIEVTENYFNSPYSWYRTANMPEKLGLELEGKNITTKDADYVIGSPNRWRTDMQEAGEVDFFSGPNGGKHLEPGTGINEGYFIFKPGSRIHKAGSAHGNTSQASKGTVWQGTTAGNSTLFPRGIIEGQAPMTINYGKTRTNFVETPWEDVPMGGRVGFHTGEMPMDNLGWFRQLPNGKYSYEPIIPHKVMEYDPNKRLRLARNFGFQPRLVDSTTYPIYRGPQFNISDIVNPDGTVNPRQAMRAQHTVADWFGGHRMENRLENSKWHKNDPTTYDHTKQTAQSAWKLPIPFGFTKRDQMIAALGHDFGKMLAGEGHAYIGADLARQVFPDLTEAQYKAIAEHMGKSQSSSLGELTKAADITNGRSFDYLQRYAPDLYNKYFREGNSGEFNDGLVFDEQSPLYVDGHGVIQYPRYVKLLGERFKQKGAKIDPVTFRDIDPDSYGYMLNKGFTPIFRMAPGKVLRAFGDETLRRMQNFGMDIDKTMGELPLYGKKSIRDLVGLNSRRSSYLGYYSKPGTLGTYWHKNGTTVVDPGKEHTLGNAARSTISSMHHERNMHGTQALLTPEMWKPYEDFLAKAFPTDLLEGVVENNVPRLYIKVPDVPGSRVPISKGSIKKEELRATVGEIIKDIYNNEALRRARMDHPNLPVEDLETIRPYFEQVVDELTLPDIKIKLKDANSYGNDYSVHGPANNPNFLEEFKNLLKVAPIAAPFIFKPNEKE